MDGPGYVWPHGVNGNTVTNAQNKGYVEYVEGSKTQVRLTSAGREALGLSTDRASSEAESLTALDGDLSDRQLQLIRNYTSHSAQGDTDGDHADMNDLLRSGADPAGEAKEMADALDDVLSRSTLKSDATLYRGLEFDEGDEPAWLDGLAAGQVIEDRAYVSTSTREKSAAAFADEASDVRVLFQINAPAGTNALDVENHPDLGGAAGTREGEILLPRGTKVRVDGVDREDNLTRIRATIVDDRPDVEMPKDVAQETSPRETGDAASEETQYPGDTKVRGPVNDILDKWVKLRGSGELTDDERNTLRKAVVAQGETAPRLYRGADIDLPDLQPGQALDFGPSATSEDEGSALPYAENGDHPVLFEFDGARGLNVQGRAEAVSGYAEQEWITAGRFYVRDVRDEDGVQVVRVSDLLPADPAAQKQAKRDPIDMDSLGLEEVPDNAGGNDGTAVPEGTDTPDVAGPSGGADPSPDFPGPVVGQGSGGEDLPDYVATFVQPGDKVYRHPQGAYIVVGPDDSVVKLGPDGKPRKTSATAAKLAVGHGSWEPVSANKPDPVKKPTDPPIEAKPLTDLPVEDSVVVSSKVEPEQPSAPAPAGSKFQVPMTFNEAPVTDVPKYIEDPDWYFQQKVDGIRGQLVIEPGKKPWFRSKSGQTLVNSSAAKITGPIADKLGAQSDYSGPRYTIDGELLDGKWYVFDVAVDGSEKVPWSDRMATAEAWVGEMHKLGLKQIQALPTARTADEKRKLWEAVNASGGEGVMMKRRDAPYNYGARVNHTLKAKITSTADVVVMARNLEGKENAEIGIQINGKLTPIGTVSMQGKEKGGAVNVGDIIEVEYLWANPTNHNLQQPRMVKRRPDKTSADAQADQLRFVSKDVVDVESAPAAAPTLEPTTVPEPTLPAGQPMPYKLTPRRLSDVAKPTGMAGSLDFYYDSARKNQSDRMQVAHDGGFGQQIWESTVPMFKEAAAGDGVRTHVAVPAERMLSILEDGRMKSAHEAKTTAGAGSSGYLTARRWYENEVMGVGGGKPVSKAMRPIYGYRSSEPSFGGLSNYGRLHVRLRPETESRTTVAFDDSLNSMATPIPLSSIQGASSDDVLRASDASLRFYRDHSSATDGITADEKASIITRHLSYVEAQVHGGVKLSDIDAVSIDRSGLEKEIQSHNASQSYYHPPSEWRKIRDGLVRQLQAVDQVAAGLKARGIDVEIV